MRFLKPLHKRGICRVIKWWSVWPCSSVAMCCFVLAISVWICSPARRWARSIAKLHNRRCTPTESCDGLKYFWPFHKSLRFGGRKVKHSIPWLRSLAEVSSDCQHFKRSRSDFGAGSPLTHQTRKYEHRSDVGTLWEPVLVPGISFIQRLML